MAGRRRCLVSIPTMAGEARAAANSPGRLDLWSAVLSVAGILFCARFVAIGADTYWAVALGRDIASRGSIPAGVPFATADSSGWPNVPVLGELVLAALAALGPVGIVVAQLAFDAVALVLLA